MRVGIDGRTLTGRFTGDRTYWRSLICAHLEAAERDSAAAHEYIVYTRLPMPPGALPPSRFVTVRTIPAASDRLWTLITFPRALKQDGVDIAHTQYTTPLSAPCPVITTVHDISFRLYPEWFPRKHRLLMNLTVPPSMRRAAAILTDSDSSRRDILRIYKLEPHRVTAIPLAAGPEFAPVPQEIACRTVKERYHLDWPFLISVGVLQPRKNLPLLLEAFARARKRVPLPHRLALTGKPGWGYEELSVQAARLHIADAVVFTGYVEDSDLPALYSAADVMAFPSLYEGFGLPPLEAMACGAPTLVSDAPAMPEVVGNGAWVLPVMDAAAWGEALARVLTDSDTRAFWSEQGRRRAADFSWARTASMTRMVYENAGARVAR